MVALPFLIPDGWNITQATLRFIIPNGYPVSPPDCFWVEPNLTVNGAKPKSSEYNNAIPEANINCHWFSWHIEQGRWSPNRDNLLTWLQSCRGRLGKVE